MQVTRLISRVRAAIRPRRPRPVILMYHRVAVVQHDPWRLAVDPERFEEQIAYLKHHRTPMSMDELVHRLRSKTLPANAVAVTFDDGYRGQSGQRQTGSGASWRPRNPVPRHGLHQSNHTVLVGRTCHHDSGVNTGNTRSASLAWRARHARLGRGGALRHNGRVARIG
jgi:hypothetical protein